MNQWKYHLCTTSESFDCKFFYNGGDLSNADIHRQFLHVISCLELIGHQVCGWSTDGNSINVKRMRIISEAAGESILPTEEWLEDQYVLLLHIPCSQTDVFTFGFAPRMKKSAVATSFGPVGQKDNATLPVLMDFGMDGHCCGSS